MIAQEEARVLQHNFIGTEHVLLGLIGEGEGVAAHALGAMGISLDAVRERVLQAVPQVGAGTPGSPPFTPRAKKVLELSLREALDLGHNYIGTEHMLLGLLREGQGVGAQVLADMGADADRVRQEVISLLSGPEAAARSAGGTESLGALARPRARLLAPVNPPACPHCGAELASNAAYWTTTFPQAADPPARITYPQVTPVRPPTPSTTDPAEPTDPGPVPPSVMPPSAARSATAEPPATGPTRRFTVVYCRVCGRALPVMPASD